MLRDFSINYNKFALPYIARARGSHDLHNELKLKICNDSKCFFFFF